MKKFFAIAFIAATMVACNNEGESKPAGDSATTPAVDTPAVVTPAVDSTVKAAVDSTVKAAVDSIKK